jgi:hypothetical protein
MGFRGSKEGEEMRTLIIVAMICAGCTNDTDDKDSCDPVGTWQMSLTSVSGDCGFDLSDAPDMTMSKADVDKEVNKDTCSASETAPFKVPETDTMFEFDGTLEMQIEFDGDELAGEATLKGDLLESGKQFDTCTETYSISGTRK